jgi:CitMHS family citrate-Mg2+:H+ or citrate-Ca2+:H+ symporter
MIRAGLGKGLSSVFLTVSLLLAAMIAAFVVAKVFLKLSVELCILCSAFAGALAAGAGLPLRHIAEGASTYLDLCLIFITATIFMNIVKEAGGIDYLVRKTLVKFLHRRVVLLVMLMLLMLIPGALTGAGSVSVLVVGGTVALVLKGLGIREDKVTAMVFILAGLSAVAPPVNIWAMIVTAGTAIPYVGFELPLGIPVLILGLFTTFWYGLRGESKPLDVVLSSIPEPPAKMNGLRVGLPFVVVLAFILMPRIWPFALPTVGLPIGFTLAGLLAWALSPKKIDLIKISRDTLDQLLPLIGTVIVVGILLQVMTLTGVRGLLSLSIISLPPLAIYLLLPLAMPLSEAVLAVGGAAVFGIPLIWTLNAIGLHPTVALSGLSLLWMLGGAIPPTALIGRLAVQTSGYKGTYWKFLKSCWLPWALITVTGTLMVVFSKQLSFLVR